MKFVIKIEKPKERHVFAKTTQSIASKKCYDRKPKHKKGWFE